jgi:hypothetical protein
MSIQEDPLVNSKVFALAQEARGFITRLLRVRVGYSWTVVIYQGLLILVCEAIVLTGAPPGVAVACLAVVAIVMAFRIVSEDFGRIEQVVWICMSVVLLFAEINAIGRDRTVQEARERRDRDTQMLEFQRILDQGSAINRRQEDELNEQRAKFSALLNQGRASIRKMSKVADDVRDAGSYASGGDTFPYLFPGEITLEDGRRMLGFYLNKHGKYPLYDLLVLVGRPFVSDAQNRSLAIPGAQCRYPELNGNWSIPNLGRRCKRPNGQRVF